MKLQYELMLKRIDDKFYAVKQTDSKKDSKIALKVDEMGMMILKLLKKERTMEDIEAILKSYYDDEEEMKNQLHPFLEQLKKTGFVK